LVSFGDFFGGKGRDSVAVVASADNAVKIIPIFTHSKEQHH